MTDFWAEAALLAYRGIGRALAPFSGLLLDARTRRGKEDRTRRGERLGRASEPRAEGPLVWVHAASVGETMSVLPLIGWLTEAGQQVVLTTGTVTSATIAARRLPAGALHQYVPMDLQPFIGRFLDHWRPDAAVFVESEVWPTTIVDLARRRIPQLLINARMSQTSLQRWLKAPAVARALFARYARILAQSEPDAARFRLLGAVDVAVTGNIKLDCQPLVADMAELQRLRRLIGTRPVWLAASTHSGEEAMVGAAARQMATTIPGLLTIVVPRHPDRRAEIAYALTAAGHSVATRSAGADPTGDIDIYLADTLGELGLFYRLAPVAFVGGTLVPIGGHNPIEAAQLETAVLHGPHVENAREIFAALDSGGGARLVSGAAELAEIAARLLAYPSEARAMARAGADFVAASSGALDRTRALISTKVIGEALNGSDPVVDRDPGQAIA